jgi:protein-tyrosine-phosphatase
MTIRTSGETAQRLIGRISRRRRLTFGMFALGLGYFLWYTPYAALAKGTSDGLLPGLDQPIGGLVLLPAHVMGQMAAMAVFVLVSRWWRYAGRRPIAGRQVPFPSRFTGESAFWQGFIVLATTLAFTFRGASIVFILVLMRIGRLIIAPSWDLIRRRKIHWYSAAALTLCMVSAIIAITDVNSYTLTFGAMLTLCLYWLGYINRFRIMSVHAKTGDLKIDRRYFIEEHMGTPFMMLLLVGIPALIGQGTWMEALRVGFTSFLTTPAVIPALLIGVFYEALFIMTSLIYLDRREFSFGMPVSVSASLLAGVVASIGLGGLYGAPLPSASAYLAAVIVICAALLLSYPTIKSYFVAQHRDQQAVRRLLFVCGGNTSRSPMAAAIARAELTAAANGHGNGNGAQRWPVESAGLTVHTPGKPISPAAATALLEIGVEVPLDHKSRQLTADLCADSEAVYCMTRAQRDKVVALVPDAADRTFCLDPDEDVPDPAGEPLDAYRECATRLRALVHDRVAEHRERYTAAVSAPSPEGV